MAFPPPASSGLQPPTVWDDLLASDKLSASLTPARDDKEAKMGDEYKAKVAVVYDDIKKQLDTLHLTYKQKHSYTYSCCCAANWEESEKTLSLYVKYFTHYSLFCSDESMERLHRLTIIIKEIEGPDGVFYKVFKDAVRQIVQLTEEHKSTSLLEAKTPKESGISAFYDARSEWTFVTYGHESSDSDGDKPPKAAGGGGAAAAAAALGAKKALPTVQKLIVDYEKCWDPEAKLLSHIPFTNSQFIAVAKTYMKEFALPYHTEEYCGHLEKKDVEGGSQIFVKADLHGDLLSLIKSLRALQHRELLDDTLKCKKGVHLVFLGDYMDRGPHSLQVLQLLLLLRMENPDQVTLIRGNHESLIQNVSLCGSDRNFHDFLGNSSHQMLLSDLYNTFPLCLLIGEAGGPHVQYSLFTHGLVEPTVDLYPLLSSSEPHAIMPVAEVWSSTGESSALSARIKAMPFEREADYEDIVAKISKATGMRREFKLRGAVQRLTTLSKTDKRPMPRRGYNTFNWGDIGEESKLDAIAPRDWKMSPKDILHYLRLHRITTPEGIRSVKQVFRGHEHNFKEHKIGERIIATTLPVARGEGVYRDEGPDIAGMLLMTKPKVKEWTREILPELPGMGDTIEFKKAELVADEK